jgi:hypothetical protein
MKIMHLNKIKYNVIEHDNFYHVISQVKNYEHSFDIFCLVSLSLFFFKWFFRSLMKVELKGIKYLIDSNIWWILILFFMFICLQKYFVDWRKKIKKIFLFHSLMKNNFENSTSKT